MFHRRSQKAGRGTKTPPDFSAHEEKPIGKVQKSSFQRKRNYRKAVCGDFGGRIRSPDLGRGEKRNEMTWLHPATSALEKKPKKGRELYFRPPKYRLGRTILKMSRPAIQMEKGLNVASFGSWGFEGGASPKPKRYLMARRFPETEKKKVAAGTPGSHERKKYLMRFLLKKKIGDPIGNPGS